MTAQVKSVAGVDVETGTTIGWDWAAYGIPLPDRIQGAARDGYNAGCHHFQSRKTLPHDRFIRKWLLLRINAWARNRIFDAAVTPQFLRQIDVSHCPITRERLTHGERLDSDWSIDRVCNNGGYAPGNLAVMSTRANLAKGTRDLADVLELVVRGETPAGLSRIEWARMATMMMMCAGDAREVVPLMLVPPPKLLVSNLYLPAQYCLSAVAACRMPPRAADDARRACHGKEAKRLFDRFMAIAQGLMLQQSARARSMTQFHWAIEDAWANPMLTEAFKTLLNTLSVEDRYRMVQACGRHDPAFRRLKEDVRAGWGRETRGYVVAG